MELTMQKNSAVFVGAVSFFGIDCFQCGLDFINRGRGYFYNKLRN